MRIFIMHSLYPLERELNKNDWDKVIHVPIKSLSDDVLENFFNAYEGYKVIKNECAKYREERECCEIYLLIHDTGDSYAQFLAEMLKFNCFIEITHYKNLYLLWVSM